MRRPLLALAVAAAIGSNAAPAARAADTSPVELAPVPWTHADTGAPPLPVETPQFAIEMRGDRSCFGSNPCPGDTESNMTVRLDSGATVFDQTMGAFRVRGRVVSSISGNVWTFGIRDLRITLPAVPAVGATLAAGDTTYYSLTVTPAFFAGFMVPFDGKNATTTLVWKPSGARGFFNFWSSRVQSHDRSAPGEVLMSSLLAGDEVTVYGPSAPLSLFGSARTEYVSGNPGTYRVESRTENRSPSCISGPEPAEGYDCTGTVELFTPRVIPSALATTCASDLTGDGVVNFADLAKMKSVFYRTCAP